MRQHVTCISPHSCSGACCRGNVHLVELRGAERGLCLRQEALLQSQPVPHTPSLLHTSDCVLARISCVAMNVKDVSQQERRLAGACRFSTWRRATLRPPTRRATRSRVRPPELVLSRDADAMRSNTQGTTPPGCAACRLRGVPDTDQRTRAARAREARRAPVLLVVCDWREPPARLSAALREAADACDAGSAWVTLPPRVHQGACKLASSSVRLPGPFFCSGERCRAHGQALPPGNQSTDQILAPELPVIWSGLSVLSGERGGKWCAFGWAPCPAAVVTVYTGSSVLHSSL